MEQLLILFPCPLSLLDGGVEPLVPAGLALLGGLADEQRGDARPLVLTVLHHGRLEDLILGVLPHPALNHDPHLARSFAAPLGLLDLFSSAEGLRGSASAAPRPGGSGETWSFLGFVGGEA